MARLLKWEKKTYLSAVLKIITAAIWLIIFLFPVGIFNTLSFLFWPWLIIGLIWFHQLIYLFSVPELEFTSDSLKLHKRRPIYILFKRDLLPIKNIISIIESTRKTSGWSKMIDLPTFIIRMVDGREYEYFPCTKSQQRLDEIKSFFSSCAVLPEVQIAENANVLNSKDEK